MSVKDDGDSVVGEVKFVEGVVNVSKSDDFKGSDSKVVGLHVEDHNQSRRKGIVKEVSENEIYCM